MLVADVMSHDGLPVRQVLTVAVRYGTVEGFTGGQFSRQPLFKVSSSCKIFLINFLFSNIFYPICTYLDDPGDVDKDS